MIKLNNLSKYYKKQNKDIIVFKNINYEFKNGMFYAIMGESGCGKSTLINIMAGLINQSNGKILFDNKEYKTDNDKAILRNQKMGIMYQSFLLNENLSALENVSLPLLVSKAYKMDKINELVKKSLKSVGLENRINHYPHEMSGGEQQRVALARALINDPKYIVCDEPTGNLDKKNEKLIFYHLKKLSKDGKTIIVVSHSENVKKYADIVLKLMDGKLYEE